MCLTGVDYFSTLGYQPAIAGSGSWGAVPCGHARACAGRPGRCVTHLPSGGPESPHGEGSIAMLERLLSWWRGKIIVLVVLGFAATDFLITMTLSTADATAHLVENPFTPDLLIGHNVAITLVLLALLGVIFLIGFREAIGIAVVLVVIYLALNLVVVVVSVAHVVADPGLVTDWTRLLVTEYPNPLMMLCRRGCCLSQACAGLSGFEPVSR